MDEFRRRRAQYGFKETILTTMQSIGGMQPSSGSAKTLLGG